MKHLNADVEGHQQEIALAGTPSPKRGTKIRKLNTKQKKLKSNLIVQTRNHRVTFGWPFFCLLAERTVDVCEHVGVAVASDTGKYYVKRVKRM